MKRLPDTEPVRAAQSKYILSLPQERAEDFPHLSSQQVWQNDSELHLELCCGNGHFLTQMAIEHPEANFIGIDYSRKRVVKAAYKAYKRELANVIYIAAEANRFVTQYLAPQSLTAVYVNFPDPWHKRRHRRRRLVNAAFLDNVLQVLQPEGNFYFVSDHANYFFSVLELLQNHSSLENAFEQPYLHHLDDYPISLYQDKWTKSGRQIHFLKYYKIKAG